MGQTIRVYQENSGGGGGAVDSVNGQTGVVVIGKADIGLGNVDNTSDLNKPISTQTQTALDTKISLSEKAVANGVATLDGGGTIPQNQIPFTSNLIYLGTWDASTNTPTLADGVGNTGEFYICNVAGTVDLGSGPITFDSGDWNLYNGSIWEKSDNTSDVVSVHGRIGNVVGELGDYTTGLVSEDADKNYITDAEKLVISNTSGTNTGDETAATIKTKYESNADTNVFNDAEKTTVSNQSGTNTGDEDNASIQAKRPLKTVNLQSLEGVGDVTISGFDPVAEGVLTDYIDSQNQNNQTSNATLPNLTTYLTLIGSGIDLSSDYRFNVSFAISHDATNSNAIVDIKDFGVSILSQVYTVEPKDNSNRTWISINGRISPNPLSGGQFQLQLDFGTDNNSDDTTLYFANISLQKINE